MTCRCSTNTLRLFVRTVAQVDIPAGSFSFRSLHPKPRAANRTFFGHRALPLQRRTNSTLAPEAVSAKSIEENTSNNTIASEPTSTESTQLDASPNTPSKSPHPDDGPRPATEPVSAEAVNPIPHELHETRRINSATQSANDPWDFDSVFVDFSPEAIDVMAAEVAAAKPVAEPTPILEKEHASIHERSQRDDEKDLASSLRVLGLSPGRKGLPKSNFKIRYSSSLESVSLPVDAWVPPKKEPWQIQKARLKEKFPEGWNPLKKLSPDAMVGIRQLHAQMPEKYTTFFLADHFKISPDSIRRILKSKWQPDADTQIRKDMRWFRRGEKVWSRYAELGVKPPRRWRDEGIGRGKPEWKKRESQQPSRVVPALLTTTRRDGGFFGSDESSSYTERDEIPELVTTRRPGH